MLHFHKPAPSTKTTYFVSNQFAYVNRQIYHNSLHIPVIFHTLDDEFHIGPKSGEKYTHLSKGWNSSQIEA